MKITAERLQMLIKDAEVQQRNHEDMAVQWNGRIIALRGLLDLERQPEPEEPAPESLKK